jgi:OstA-like protein
LKNYFFFYPKYATLFYLFVFFSLAAKCQENRKVELLNADVLEFDQSLGINAKRLLGNVQFKHENVLMYCDSAYFYEDDNIDAFSNVRITQGDSITLTSEFLNYVKATKQARVWGKEVILTDPDIKLTTTELFYNTGTSIAQYNNSAVIVNKDSKLQSVYGKYFSNQKQFLFSKKVVLNNPDYNIFCDTLKQQTNTQVSYFFGNTKIINKENTIICRNGWYDDKNSLTKTLFFIAKAIA